MSDIRFGKEDVTVQQVDYNDCARCSEPIGNSVPWYIALDFRGTGVIGAQYADELYCSERCAEEEADELRATLPHCEDES